MIHKWTSGGLLVSRIKPVTFNSLKLCTVHHGPCTDGIRNIGKLRMASSLIEQEAEREKSWIWVCTANFPWHRTTVTSSQLTFMPSSLKLCSLSYSFSICTFIFTSTLFQNFLKLGKWLTFFLLPHWARKCWKLPFAFLSAVEATAFKSLTAVAISSFIPRSESGCRRWVM